MGRSRNMCPVGQLGDTNSLWSEYRKGVDCVGLGRSPSTLVTWSTCISEPGMFSKWLCHLQNYTQFCIRDSEVVCCQGNATMYGRGGRQASYGVVDVLRKNFPCST